MAGYQLRPAQRSQAKPLIGLYAESGCGKTYSALLLARGFVGPQGRIAMIETEGGRGESYSDRAEYPEIGGYDVVPIRGEFPPSAYGEALTVCEDAKVDALIIDSASHEWEGAGGVLSMAAANQAGGMKGVIVWQRPKLEHQRHFMLRLIQTAIPLVIVCMRAKYPMVERPKSGGGKEWVRSDALEPKQAEDILFEMFVHGWIDRDHKFRLTKCTAKALQAVFADGQPITVDVGRQMAAWARGAAAPAAKPAAAPPADDPAATAILAQAQQVIRDGGGTAGYRAFFQKLTKEQRALIAPQHESLKQQAARNDAPADAQAGAA